AVNHCAGKAGVYPPVPVVTRPSRNFFGARAPGAAATRPSLRPLLLRGTTRCKTRTQIAPRGYCAWPPSFGGDAVPHEASFVKESRRIPNVALVRGLGNDRLDRYTGLARGH